MENTIINSVERVEKRRGIIISGEEIMSALILTIQKMRAKNKEKSYFPLLLETELEEAVDRKMINAIGGF